MGYSQIKWVQAAVPFLGKSGYARIRARSSFSALAGLRSSSQGPLAAAFGSLSAATVGGGEQYCVEHSVSPPWRIQGDTFPYKYQWWWWWQLGQLLRLQLQQLQQRRRQTCWSTAESGRVWSAGLVYPHYKHARGMYKHLTTGKASACFVLV